MSIKTCVHGEIRKNIYLSVEKKSHLTWSYELCLVVTQHTDLIPLSIHKIGFAAEIIIIIIHYV